jgi:hypothetical protein
MTVRDPNLFALRLLSAMGDYDRTAAMLGQIRREDGDTIYDVLAALLSHVADALDALAPMNDPRRDQWRAWLSEVTDKMAAQRAAFDRDE